MPLNKTGLLRFSVIYCPHLLMPNYMRLSLAGVATVPEIHNLFADALRPTSNHAPAALSQLSKKYLLLC